MVLTPRYNSLPLDYCVSSHVRLLLRQLHYNRSALEVDWSTLEEQNPSSSVTENPSGRYGESSSFVISVENLPRAVTQLVHHLESCLLSQQSSAALILGPPDADKTGALRTAVRWVNLLTSAQHPADPLSSFSSAQLFNSFSVDAQHSAKGQRSVTRRRERKASNNEQKSSNESKLSNVWKFCIIAIPRIHHRDDAQLMSAIVRQLFSVFLSLFDKISGDERIQLQKDLNNGKPLRSEQEVQDAFIKKAKIEWAVKTVKKLRAKKPGVKQRSEESPESTRPQKFPESRDVVELKLLTSQQNVNLIKIILKFITNMRIISVIVLENIENCVLRTSRQTLLYNLFSLVHVDSVRLCVIGTSSILNIASHFEKRVKSRFGLRRIFSGVSQNSEELGLALKKNLSLTPAQCKNILNRVAGLTLAPPPDNETFTNSFYKHISHEKTTVGIHVVH